MDIFVENLKKKHYAVSYFPTAANAAEYLCSQIQNTTVGFGDSETLLQMGLAKRPAEKNTVIYQRKEKNVEAKVVLIGEALGSQHTTSIHPFYPLC